MAERTTKVTLIAQVSQYLSGMEQAAKKTREAGTESEKLAQKGEAFQKLGTASLAFGALAAAGVGVAVSKFADFDAAMSNVQASTHETTGNMALLRDAALQAGADTAFSATEAADAIDELSKAGLSTTAILSGGLTGALDLASAGGLGVARAAEISATALSQFQLKGSDAAHVADVLAAGAGKAMGSVDDLANGLKYVGPIAASMGISIEETTGTLALFAQQGIIGEQAGTSLRGVLSALTSPSAAAAKEIKRLGINLYDSNGEFIGMEGAAGQLSNAFGGMDTASRQASLGVIFGAESITAATALYQAGSQGVAEWTANVDDSGYAAETARLKLDNLKGDVDALGGSFDTALIKTGSAANDSLRMLVQGATSAVDAFSALPQPVQSTALGVGGIAAATALAGGAFLTVVPKIGEAKAALDLLTGTTTGARTVMSGIGTFLAGPWGLALGVAGLAVGAFAGEQAAAATRTKELGETLDTTTHQITGSTREMVKANLAAKQMFLTLESDSAYDSAEKLGISLDLVTRSALGEVDALKQLNQELDVGTFGSDRYKAALEESGLSATDYSAAVTTVTKEVTGNSKSIEEAIRVAQQKQTADAGSVDSTMTVAEAYLAQGEATATLTDQLSQLIDKVNEANGRNQDAASANIAYQQTIADIDESIRKAQEGTEGYALTLDTTTQAGRDNYSMLLELAQNGEAAAKATFTADQNTQGYKAALDASKQAVYDRALALTGNADAAQAIADNIAEIPTATEWKVIAETAAAQERLDTFIRNNDGRTIGIIVNTAAGSNAVPSTLARNGTTVAYASGGMVTGPGTGTSDSIIAALSNGEYVVRAAQTEKNRGALEFINSGGVIPGYAGGGYVSGPAYVGGAITSTSTIAPVVEMSGNFYSYDPSALARDAQREMRRKLALSGMK